jgi:hypothetical protein
VTRLPTLRSDEWRIVTLLLDGELAQARGRAREGHKEKDVSLPATRHLSLGDLSLPNGKSQKIFFRPGPWTGAAA